MQCSRLLLTFVASIVISGHIYAEDVEAMKMQAVKDYGKCIVTSLSIAENDQEAYEVTELFYRASLDLIQELIALEIGKEKGSKPMASMQEILGQEGLKGFMLARLQNDPSFKAERDRLRIEHGFDWRKSDRILWDKHGCSAIYSSLRKQ